MDLDLGHRVYVVTGGARGLGRATADVLVAEGARVVLSGRSQEALDKAAAELGASAVTMAADNADPATPARLVEAAENAWGRLDGALISVGGPPTGTVTGVSDEQGSSAFESVFLGAVGIAREVAQRLGEGGSIAFACYPAGSAPSASRTSTRPRATQRRRGSRRSRRSPWAATASRPSSAARPPSCCLPRRRSSRA